MPCLLAFAGLLCFSEALALNCNDVQFFPDHLKLRIRQSKTDQLHQGDQVLIASMSSPVDMLQRYVRMVQLDTSSPKWLFRGITKTKKGERLREDGSISYTRMRELVIGKLKELGYDSAAA